MPLSRCCRQKLSGGRGRRNRSGRTDEAEPGDAAGSARGKVRSSPRMVADDQDAARRSVAKLATLEFDVAVFGHGPPVTGGAVERFRELAASG